MNAFTDTEVANPISSTVDFTRDGVQHGFLKLPHSRDDSAWGAVMIPITVVKHGDGPTALLTGGNHGDEYEGPVALSKLAQRLRADQVSGRVIIVPFMNTPAFHAGTRTSPIDQETSTAAFRASPMAQSHRKSPITSDAPCCRWPMWCWTSTPVAAPWTFCPSPPATYCPTRPSRHAAKRACGRSQRPMPCACWSSMPRPCTTPLPRPRARCSSPPNWGGGTATARSVALAERGVHNLLVHAGILKGEVTPDESIMLDMPDGDCFIASEHDGLLEMCRDLGEQVSQGEVIARIHDIRRTGSAPVEYRARRDGLLAARHFPGLVQCGDTLAVIADVLE